MRPVCVHCGQLYGQRVTRIEVVRWKRGEEPPPYCGNGVVVKDHVWRTEGSSGELKGVSFTVEDCVSYRHIWDGESYSTPYKPFCKLRCALDYARKVYKIYEIKIGKS